MISICFIGQHGLEDRELFSISLALALRDSVLDEILGNLIDPKWSELVQFDKSEKEAFLSYRGRLSLR